MSVMHFTVTSAQSWRKSASPWTSQRPYKEGRRSYRVQVPSSRPRPIRLRAGIPKSWYWLGPITSLLGTESLRLLYTAMTRARSVLAIYGQQNAPGHGSKIMPAVKECLDLLVEGDDTVFVSVDDLVEICGDEHRGWLENIGRRHRIVQEPVTSAAGEILSSRCSGFKRLWASTPVSARNGQAAMIATSRKIMGFGS